MNQYLEKLSQAVAARGHLCVGLDPDPRLTKPDQIADRNIEILLAAAEHAAACKLNLGFYLAAGPHVWHTLTQAISVIRHNFPGLLIIGDAKAGDTENSSRAWANALFEQLGFDAVTVNPYGGQDSLLPFLEYGREKGVYVWCRSSNPGAADFQDPENPDFNAPEPLYMRVIARTQDWNVQGNAGLVIGANVPAAINYATGAAPELPLLLPGIGAQQADLTAAVQAAEKSAAPYLVSVSRAIYYAQRESGQSPTEAAAQAARHYSQEIKDAAAARNS